MSLFSILRQVIYKPLVVIEQRLSTIALIASESHQWQQAFPQNAMCKAPNLAKVFLTKISSI